MAAIVRQRGCHLLARLGTGILRVGDKYPGFDGTLLWSSTPSRRQEIEHHGAEADRVLLEHHTRGVRDDRDAGAGDTLRQRAQDDGEARPAYRCRRRTASARGSAARPGIFALMAGK